MRDAMTTALDVLGVLVVATSVGWAAVAVAGPVGGVAAGVVLIGAARLADRMAVRADRLADGGGRR